MLAKHPELSVKQIAFRAKASKALVYEIKSQLRRKAKVKEAQEATGQIHVPVMKLKANDKVKAEVKQEVKATTEIKYSERYTKAVDLIADYKLNFNLGSAVAHVLRANTDNRQADIKAAIWYLTNELVSYEK